MAYFPVFIDIKNIYSGKKAIEKLRGKTIWFIYTNIKIIYIDNIKHLIGNTPYGVFLL